MRKFSAIIIASLLFVAFCMSGCFVERGHGGGGGHRGGGHHGSRH